MSKVTTTHAAIILSCILLILLLSTIFPPITSNRKPNASYISMIDTGSKPISKPTCVKPKDTAKPLVSYDRIATILMQGKLMHVDDQLVTTEYKFISLLAYIINNPAEHRNKEDSFVNEVSKFNTRVNNLHVERNLIIDTLKLLNQP